MFLPLLTLTLGVMVVGLDAGKLFYEVQQQQQMPAEEGILCPDRASMCSNSATCCMLSSGKWGCCPFTGATCCGAKCCPNGYSCNQTKQQCVKAALHAEMMIEAVDDVPEAPENLAADIAFASVDVSVAPSPFGKVRCDSKYYCQTGQTCCRRSGSKWGCCPFTGGTCCKKGKVCCPQGKRCSNPPGKCY